MSLKRRFGHRLACLRKSRGLTQDQLAERCGVSVDTISNIERGIHGPRFDLLESLADSLAVSVTELFIFSDQTLPS